jgi:glycosyltransferase involved in cell wall biosynthesis
LKHIVSIVLNQVTNDSRVLKTAQSAVNLGYTATIIGLSKKEKEQRFSVGDVNVILASSPVPFLRRSGLWQVNMQERDPRLFLMSCTDRILPVVTELQPDLIHSHDMFGLRVGAQVVDALAVSGRSIPWLHDVHEFVGGLTLSPPLYRSVALDDERTYLRRADSLVTVSEPLANILADTYKLQTPPTVIFNAPVGRTANLTSSDVRGVLNLSRNTPLAVYVGGMSGPERDGATLIRAIAKLDDVHLCFVSQRSPYLDEQIVLANQLGIGHRVHRLDVVPHYEVPLFIRSADAGICALTHHPNGEVAMPNKLFEYLSADLPVVASDLAELRRFIGATGIGEMFCPGDPDACASSLNRVLSAAETYRGNITSGLKDTYSWEVQEGKLADIYRRLFARYDSNRSNRRRRELIVTDNPSDAAWIERERLRMSDVEADVLWYGEDPPRPVDLMLSPADGMAGTVARLINVYDAIQVTPGCRFPFAAAATGDSAAPFIEGEAGYTRPADAINGQAVLTSGRLAPSLDELNRWEAKCRELTWQVAALQTKNKAEAVELGNEITALRDRLQVAEAVSEKRWAKVQNLSTKLQKIEGSRIFKVFRSVSSMLQRLGLRR